MIDFILVLVAFVAMLAINHVVYKREKTLLEISEKYKSLYFHLLDEDIDLRKIIVKTDNKKEAYRKAIYDCIENFNEVYSNTKLSFDEELCAFVVEDIDVDNSLPTKEEITQQNEKDNENQQSI